MRSKKLKKYKYKSRSRSVRNSKKTVRKNSNKSSRIKKKKIQGGKYRFNYNLQLFEKFI